MKQRRDEGFVRSELDDSRFVVAVIVASCWVSFSAGTYESTTAARLATVYVLVPPISRTNY